MLGSSSLPNDSSLKSNTFNGFACNANESAGNDNASYGISVLDTLELDTTPDFDLSVSFHLPLLILPLSFPLC